MKQIGIYPGTFDPIHPGHIAFALRARELCQLDQVVFLPEAFPRGKQNVNSLKQRIDWLQKALVDQPALSFYTPASSPFTVQTTLPELRSAFPATSMTLLVGSDVFRQLPNWPGIKELLSDINLAIGLRHDDSIEAMKEVVPNTPGTITYIKLPDTAHLSSRNTRASS